jgi:hypothetical protein
MKFLNVVHCRTFTSADHPSVRRRINAEFLKPDTLHADLIVHLKCCGAQLFLFSQDFTPALETRKQFFPKTIILGLFQESLGSTPPYSTFSMI